MERGYLIGGVEGEGGQSQRRGEEETETMLRMLEKVLRNDIIFYLS